MIGTWCVRATCTTSLTSASFSTQMTASGGWLGIQVIVLACWRRMASPVCNRSPKRWRSTAMAVAVRSPLPIADLAMTARPKPVLVTLVGPRVPMHTPAALAAPGALVSQRQTMFTRSCSDVKVPLLATERIFVDVLVTVVTRAAVGLCEEEMGHVWHRFTPGCPAGCSGKRQHTRVPGARGGGSHGLQHPRPGYGRCAGHGSGYLTGCAGQHLRLCPALPQQRASVGLGLCTWPLVRGRLWQRSSSSLRVNALRHRGVGQKHAANPPC